MVDSTALAALRDSLTGNVVMPDDDGYDDHRAVWNGMIDRRPALIAMCANADDVAATVRFARAQSLPATVRCGGHSVAGKSVADGAVLIDLSNMADVTVDAEARRARIQGGARLGALDAATQPHGLATTAGMVSDTGVGGLALGGGVGYLARRFGVTSDNLVSAEVVTAAGEQIRASATENADLFWALRGGGGNFGIVTEFEFRLHEVGPEVLVGQAFHPIEAAAEVLRFYRELTADAPDELAAYAFAACVPPVDPFPAEFHGKPTMAVVCCWSGSDHDRGREALAPLESFGEPIFRFVAPMPYVALQQSFDAGSPSGQRYYWKAHFLEGLPDEAIETFVAHTRELPGPFTLAGFEPMGGAIGRVDPQETAFPHRDAPYALGIWSGWADPADDEAAIAWTRKLHAAMEPFSNGGVYSNYLDVDDDDLVESAFASNFDRLRTVKAKYDPDNFFRSNPNVAPAD